MTTNPPDDPSEGRPEPGSPEPSGYQPYPSDGGEETTSGYPTAPPPPPGSFEGYGPQGFSARVAIAYGWRKFAANPGAWILIALLFIVIQVVISGLTGGFKSGDVSETYSPLRIIGSLVSAVVGWILQAQLVKGALSETTGTKATVGQLFKFENVGAVIIASIIVGILSTIGFLLVVIPGLVVIFLSMFVYQYLQDRDLDGVTAVRASFGLVWKNFGKLIGLALLLILINLVGLCLVGIGLLVTLPITAIATTYAYKTLQGDPVAP